MLISLTIHYYKHVKALIHYLKVFLKGHLVKKKPTTTNNNDNNNLNYNVKRK